MKGTTAYLRRLILHDQHTNLLQTATGEEAGEEVEEEEEEELEEKEVYSGFLRVSALLHKCDAVLGGEGSGEKGEKKTIKFPFTVTPLCCSGGESRSRNAESAATGGNFLFYFFLP